MKRMVVVLLACCILFASFSSLSSCSKWGKTEIELSKYQLVSQNNFSPSIKKRIERLAASMGEMTGNAVSIHKENVAESADGYEILIGDVDREETQKVLQNIKGDGYAVSVTGKKIVLVGTSKILTYMAVCDFMDQYLPSGQCQPVFLMEKKKVVEQISTIDFDDNYNIIYSDDIDDTRDEGIETPDENPLGYDYPFTACKQIQDQVKMLLNLQISLSSDVKEAGEREILVGVTSRPESKDYMEKLDATEYGIAVKNGKIVVSGMGDTGLHHAVSFFNNILKDCICKAEDGKRIFRLPRNMECKEYYTGDGWRLDFPRVEGENIHLSSLADVADHSVELYYDGEGVSPESYLAYCEKLQSAGYSVYMENTIEGSIYRTYINREAGISLHVVYAAYRYAAENQLDLKPCIRVISSPLDSVNLLPQSAFSVGQFEKVTETSLTTMELDYENRAYGTCYIITLEDGSFIVIDSGFHSPVNLNRFKNILNDLYFRSFGHEPTPEQPITIAAWYLTHSHGDHFNNFFEFCRVYGKTFKFEMFLHNFASDEECFNSMDPNRSLRNQFEQFQSYVDGMTYYKLHTGQRFFVRNVEFEVLCTHEDIHPARIGYFNDTGSVCRLTFHHTDGKGNISGKPTTFLSTGDAQFLSSQFMRATYGTYLKSDMCTVAHHGTLGCEFEFYDYVSPEFVLFPCWSKQYGWWTEWGADPEGNYFCRVDHYLAKVLPSVKYVIVSDEFNLTISITAEGPDMRLENLYNAANPEAPIYFGSTIIVK